MKVLILTTISALALPLMAFGQGAEPQQGQGQEQPKEPAKQTETTAPVKGKKAAQPKEQSTPKTKAEAGTEARGQTNVQQPRTEEPKKDAAAGAEGPGSSETNVKSETKTKVSVEEFKTRHSEVFHLGKHPKEFFVQRYGANHVRLIGSAYFIWVDNCWVAVDVDGYGFTERVICAGDPEYIEIN